MEKLTGGSQETGAAVVVSENGKGSHLVEVETKDAAPIIDGSALRMPSADFWPLNSRQGTIEVASVNWYAAARLAYSCMRYRATKLIEPPIWVSDEQDGEESWVKGAHPIEELLQRPNPDMSMSDLLELTSLYLDSTTGCVWHKVRDGAGRPARLYPYSGDELKVESALDDDGLPRIFGKFTLTVAGGRKKVVGPDDVVYFRNANPGDLHSSLPPLHAALARLRIERQLEAGIGHGLRNAVRVGSSIKFPDGVTLTPAQIEEYQRLLLVGYTEAVNRAKAMVTGNATYQTHDLALDGLSGGVLTEENEVAVCSCFQVHPAVVGARVGLIHSSDKHNMDAVVDMFYDIMALPTWSRWEDTLTVSLLRDFDPNPRHFLRFDKTRVRALKEDLSDKALVVDKLRPELDLDERRALLGYPAATPEQRDEITASQTAANPFAGLGKALTGKSLPPFIESKVTDRETLWKLRDSSVRKQEAAWLVAATKQLAKDRRAALALADETLKPGKAAAPGVETKGPPFGADPESVRRLIAALAEKLDIENAWSSIAKTQTSATARRAVRNAAAEVGLSFDVLQPGLSKYVTEHAADLVQGVGDTTRSALKDALKAGLEAGEDIPALRKRIEESGAFAPSRAELIARTEATTVTNNAGVASLSNWAAENESTVEKSWLATQDARTREEHAAMDGETVRIDDVFSNGLAAPGEPNCRCSLTYAIAEE